MFKRYKAAKRVLALLLCGCLVFGSVNQARFKSYAVVTEIIAGGAAIAGGLAIGYLLHMLGVTAADKAVYKSKETVIDWTNEQVAKYKKWNAANKDAYKSDDLDKEFGAWATKLKQGTLDKSSAIWKDFKSYVSGSYYKASLPSDRTNVAAGVNAHYYCRYNDLSDEKILEISFSNPLQEQALYCYVYPNHPRTLYFGLVYRFTGNPAKVTFHRYYAESGKDITLETVRIAASNSSAKLGEIYTSSIGSIEMDEEKTMDSVYKPNFMGTCSGFDASLKAKSLSLTEEYSAGTVDGTLTGGISDVYNKSNVLDNVDIVGGVDAPTAVGAVSVPIAWPVNEDTLVDTLGGVKDGSIPWDKTLSNVGTAAVDVAKDGTYVIGNEGVTKVKYVYAKDKADAKDEQITVPDVVAPSANLGAYTIAGLEKMFPFCLPFDLIDFIKILDAPAEAPKFTIPFKYPTRSGTATYDIVIDLSSFNSVAELLRDMECLAFIVGLIMITRSRMIRG